MSKCEEKSYRGRKKASRERFLRPRPKAEAEKCSRDALFSTKVTFFHTRTFSEQMRPDNYGNRLLFCTLSYISYEQGVLGMNSKHFFKKLVEKKKYH